MIVLLAPFYYLFYGLYFLAVNGLEFFLSLSLTIAFLIVVAAYFIILWFINFEHVMFWLPVASPVLQVVLVPLAAFFLLKPDTIWTKPELFPKNDFAGLLYTWAMGKVLFMGSYIVLPLTFTGHFFNYTVWDEFEKFNSDDYSAITSQDAALIMVLLWMALPYMVPFAWANDFYMWFLQIPNEIYLYTQLNLHWQVNYDKNCNYNYDYNNQEAQNEFIKCMETVYIWK